MNAIRGRAQRVMGTPVRLADLALAFDESRAATAEVHVDGRGFFPPMLADIGTAASSGRAGLTARRVWPRALPPSARGRRRRPRRARDAAARAVAAGGRGRPAALGA
ncbi:MAG: hypothetical protein ACXWWQ_08375 [Candidatus Limnocylindria bacterium]